MLIPEAILFLIEMNYQNIQGKMSIIFSAVLSIIVTNEYREFSQASSSDKFSFNN